MVLTGVPYEDLDLPKLDDLSTVRVPNMFNIPCTRA
jgi:hypothetical protein